MLLYRPIGEAELQLIAATGFLAFPPRLSHQPIFYPVLDHDYAVQIARDWNTKDEASGFAGWVTEFDLDDDFAARYPVQLAGGRGHRELWVAAEELMEFNAHIIGRIRVTSAFFGSAYVGQNSMIRSWNEIKEFYEDLVHNGLKLQPMVRLIEEIQGSRYVIGLYAWTSMYNLCVVQMPVNYPYDGPYLRVSPLFDGRVEFRYLDTSIPDRQWHRTVREEEIFSRLEHFINQLHWFDS